MVRVLSMKDYIFLIYLFVLYSASEGLDKALEKHLTSLKLPPCQACKMVADSFLKGMERTARSHFGGGDTAWEEEKLGSYATSEVRFVEIQEHLCDEGRAKDQCLTLAEDWDEHLENWWRTEQKKTPDLVQYLCIDTVRHCCPNGHFGPNCDPCPGYPDKICNNNGKCKGNGTRKGNGKCSCDDGYIGNYCDSCDVGYYEAYKDEDKLLCSKCHAACQGPCTQAGTKGCLACAAGWLIDPERGCIDIDECLGDKPPCAKNQFCVNNEGSYSCLDCDLSCDGCSGDGPDMCDQCASGYMLRDGLCVDSKGQDVYSNMTRYLTYLGLTVATCIIFQNNPLLASGVGLSVALYVTVSEYLIGSLSLSSPDIISSFFKS